MGNRQSHNFAKSKSTSLSNIPYKWENQGYATKQRQSSLASTSPIDESATKSLTRNNNKLSNTKRTTSLGSLNDATNRKSAPPTQQVRSTSKTAQPQRSVSVIQQPVSANRPTSTGGRQYNDARLQSDIKKLFKAHDKSNAKALIEDEDNNTATTAESLDKRLETLKRQRQKPDTVDSKAVTVQNTTASTLPKKSKKDKKAPTLPPVSKQSAPKIQSQPNSNGVRTSTMQKKKSAPAPPPPQPAPATLPPPEISPPPQISVTPPTEILVTPAAPLPEKSQPSADPITVPNGRVETSVRIDEKLAEITIPSPVIAKQEAPEDTNNNNSSNENLTTVKITEVPVKPLSSILVESIKAGTSPVKADAPSYEQSKKVNSEPQTNHALPDEAHVTNEPRTTKIERELRSSSTLTRKAKKAPHAPPTTPIPAEVISRLPDDVELELGSSDEAAFMEAITKRAVDDDKAAASECREIAVQYDAPVDMAVQCDGATLREQSQRDEKEKLGNILKLFIDKNAAQDARRNPDDKSPDTEEILSLSESVSPPQHAAISHNEPSQSPTQVHVSLSTDVAAVIPAITDSCEKVTSENPPLSVDIVGGDDSKQTVKHSNSSPTSSADSGHDEPSTLSSSINTGSHSPESQPTISPFMSPTITPYPGATAEIRSDSSHTTSPELEGKQKKGKNRYSGIHRITKTMRSFMSSISKGSSSKSSSPKEEIESPDGEQAGTSFTGDNWVLSKTDKPAVVRKEYHPTWTDNTFTSPAAVETTTEKAGDEKTGRGLTSELNDTISLSSTEDDLSASAPEVQPHTPSADPVSSEVKEEQSAPVQPKLPPAVANEVTGTVAEDESVEAENKPEVIIIEKSDITYKPTKPAPQVAPKPDKVLIQRAISSTEVTSEHKADTLLEMSQQLQTDPLAAELVPASETQVEIVVDKNEEVDAVSTKIEVLHDDTFTEGEVGALTSNDVPVAIVNSTERAQPPENNDSANHSDDAITSKSYVANDSNSPDGSYGFKSITLVDTTASYPAEPVGDKDLTNTSPPANSNVNESIETESEPVKMREKPVHGASSTSIEVQSPETTPNRESLANSSESRLVVYKYM